MSQLFASGGQSIGASASASVLPVNVQGRFPLGLTSLTSLLSKGLSRVFSNITVQKHQFFDTQLSLLEKEMITHSSTLAWKTPRMEEPGRLQSMGSLRVDMTEKLHFQFSLSTFMHWKRKWQPTPVFLPEASQGQRSLVGCRLWGHTELDKTEVT